MLFLRGVPFLATVLVNEIEIKEGLPVFSIETEMVPPDGELWLTDITFSELVREHYKKESEQQAQSLKDSPNEKDTETQSKIDLANYDAFTGLLSNRYMSVLVKESF